MSLSHLQDQIDEALLGHNADYCEIRVEESASLRIERRLLGQDSIGQSTGLGGCVRAAYKGGWGFVSFNHLDNLHAKVVEAVNQAKAAQRTATLLSPVAPNVDNVVATIGKDPATVAIRDKVALMNHYRDLMLDIPKVSSVDIIYSDNSRSVLFANSEGSRIQQQFVHVVFRAQANSIQAGDVQQAGFSIGSLGDYALVENLDTKITEAAERAVALHNAEALEGGERTVVLDPVLAGVFVHEAFGHLSESDNVAENDKLRDLMYLGRRFGGKHLNFTDGGALPNLRGSYKYDDEGTPATVTPLVREGELVGRLHSRETAALLAEQPTGNARAISASFPPIVRMTNTIIEPGEAMLDDLLKEVDDGLYVANWYGGMTQHEMFTFSSGEVRRIRRGRIEESVRPVMLSGNLFTTLSNIDAVGNDINMNQGGGCGKGGQMPLPVSNGSPHIRIRNCLISSA